MFMILKLFFFASRWLIFILNPNDTYLYSILFIHFFFLSIIDFVDASVFGFSMIGKCAKVMAVFTDMLFYQYQIFLIDWFDFKSVVSKYRMKWLFWLYNILFLAACKVLRTNYIFAFSIWFTVNFKSLFNWETCEWIYRSISKFWCIFFGTIYWISWWASKWLLYCSVCCCFLSFLWGYLVDKRIVCLVLEKYLSLFVCFLNLPMFLDYLKLWCKSVVEPCYERIQFIFIFGFSFRVSYLRVEMAFVIWFFL